MSASPNPTPTPMEEERTLEFELPIPPPVSNPFAAHVELRRALKLNPDDALLCRIFDILAGISDPFTQPEDSDSVPLSVNTLSNVAITLSYQTLLDIRRESRNRDEKSSDSASDAEENDSGDEDSRIRQSKEKWATFESPHVASLRFTLSTKFFAILKAINKLLRADDELRVRYLHNDVKNWENTAVHWLPNINRGSGELGLDPEAHFNDVFSSLKLLYYICCVVIMALHRLFAPADSSPYNQALNPYSEHFLRLWKTHTSIIALALEMDRELEEEAWVSKSEYLDTPYLVKRTLLGSSAVRSVLAYVLEPTQGICYEQDTAVESKPGKRDQSGPELENILEPKSKIESTEPEQIESTEPEPEPESESPLLGENGRPCLENDLYNDSLINFYDPLARTAKGCGSISSDKRLYAVVALIRRSFLAMTPFPKTEPSEFPHFDPEDYARRTLARSSPYGSATDLSVDIYYQDQFDDDIKYVFGYFDSEDEASGSEHGDNESVESEVVFGMAERQKEDEIEFDEQGRDWRDCARGQNREFTDHFLALEAESKKLGDERLSDHFFFTWFELQQALEFLALAKIENVDTFIDRVGQVTVDTVAKAIRDEMLGRNSKISPDKIHKYLVSPARPELLLRAHEELPLLHVNPTTNFELILIRNPHCALAILDEMFMCKGLRRSLIWFLTHSVNPRIMRVVYAYEFVMGMRGNSDKRPCKYKFSRKGALEITPVEQSMILHEIFIIASSLASIDESKMSQSTAISTILSLCVMIKNLVTNNIIKKNTEDSFENYAHDIQVLLVPWIGKVPEARELFFIFKSEEYRPLQEPEVIEPEPEKEDHEFNDDIMAVVESLRYLSVSQYAKKAQEAGVRGSFVNFAKRLFSHINSQFEHAHMFHVSLPKTYRASRDFGIFLSHFNEFARNTAFVDTLADMMEQYDVMTNHDNKNELQYTIDDLAAEAQLDSEFSDAFLNGEGDFQESPASEKKKKKKPKKKRGKRK